MAAPLSTSPANTGTWQWWRRCWLRAPARTRRSGTRIAALHIASASRHGHLAVVEALLAPGAGKNAKKRGGNTALYIASEYRHLAVVEALWLRGLTRAPQDAGRLHRALHRQPTWAPGRGGGAAGCGCRQGCQGAGRHHRARHCQPKRAPGRGGGAAVGDSVAITTIQTR